MFANLLAQKKGLSLTNEQILSLDTALDLQALNSVVHVYGDHKVEIVHVCSDNKREYIAKFANFGFPIVQATESEEVWIGGARLLRGPVPVRI